MPQLERCSRGGKISCKGGQTFWAGLISTEFSVDLQKKGLRAKLVYISPNSLLVPKKQHHLETAARERGVWVGMLGSLGGVGIFVWGAPPPFSPPVAALNKIAEIWILKHEIFLLRLSLLDELQELKWDHVGKLNFLRFFLRFSKIGLNARFSHSTGNALS